METQTELDYFAFSGVFARNAGRIPQILIRRLSIRTTCIKNIKKIKIKKNNKIKRKKKKKKNPKSSMDHEKSKYV